MGGKAKSSSSSATTSSTSTVTDSYNQTYNRVSNLSDVGNVKFDLGGANGADTSGGGMAGMIIPILVGGAIVFGLALMRKAK